MAILSGILYIIPYAFIIAMGNNLNPIANPTNAPTKLDNRAYIKYLEDIARVL